ncbi:hypothetical protein BC332_28580 [Capsicum chinense]|nr:hypothetical protein BC332_28580 [Capsicum chinense]
MPKFSESHWNGVIGKMGLSTMRGYHGGPLKFDNCEFFLLRDALRVQVVEGKMLVTLEQEDVEDYTKEWNNALILYIIGEAPSYAYLKAYSGITWNTVTFPEVFYQEKANQELNKWLGLQKKVFKKKVKAHWIEAGDGNTNYFFKCLKARANANAISALKDNSGRVLHKAQEIENGVLWFYSNLLGSSSFNMSAIDIPNMRLGQS